MDTQAIYPPSRSASVVLLLASVLLWGCGRQAEESAPPLPQSATRRPAPPPSTLQGELDAYNELPYEHNPARRPVILSQPNPDRRAWLVSVLKEGYSQTHPNEQWDGDTEKAFEAYALYTRGRNTATHFASLTNAVATAIAKGRKDPMLDYLRVRYGVLGTSGPSEFAISSVRAFRAMILGHYHPYLKFMVGFRAVDAARTAEPKGDRSLALAQVTAALEDLARDTNAPVVDVFDCAFLWAQFAKTVGWTAYVMTDLEEILQKTWGQDERFFRLRGLAELDRAWKARGSGFANTVTDQGWEQLRTHLNQAALSLENSWNLNPSNAYTAYLMMQVELGQGQGRSRMEKWFNRAMDLATNYYDAADLMSFYLQPRWYGSDEIALQFARSCVQSTRWGGTVPLVLPNLHHSLAAYYQQNDSPRYFQKPGVWEDVRSAYLKFFQLNPQDVGYRHNYARDAYLCGHYDEFLAQAKLFPATNLQYFGGEAKFNEMLRRATAK